MSLAHCTLYTAEDDADFLKRIATALKDGGGPKLSLEAVLMLWRTHFVCKVVQKGLAQDQLAQLFETDLPSSMLWLETGHEGAGFEHIRCEHETDFIKVGLSCTDGVSLGMAGTNGNLQVFRGDRSRLFGLIDKDQLSKKIMVGFCLGDNGFMVSAYPMGRKSFNKACKALRITFDDPWQDGDDSDDSENSEDSEDSEDSEADNADPPFDNGRREHWDGNLARPINSMRKPSETRNRAYFLRRCLDHELTEAEAGHRHFEICYWRDLEPRTGKRWQEAMEVLVEDVNRAIFGMGRDRFLEFWIAIRLPILAYELAQFTTTQVFFQFGRTMVEARGASVRRVLHLLWQQYDDVTTPQLREQLEPDMPQLSSSHRELSSRPASAISSQNTPSSRPASGIASSPPCRAGHAVTRLLS